MSFRGGGGGGGHRLLNRLQEDELKRVRVERESNEGG